MFKYVPDWFVTAEMPEKCQDEEWVEAYKQRKAQKANIKEELLPVAWHPDRVIKTGALMKTRRKYLKSCGGLMSEEIFPNHDCI